MPLWAQVLADLRARLAAGEFESGFPTDEELRHHYGVSRQTVREAARRLQAEGVIVRERGRGSALAGTLLEQPLHTLYSLAYTVQELGLDERSTVLAARQEPAGAAGEALQIEPEAPVVYIERLRHVNDEPLSLHRSWFPAERASCLLDLDLRSGSLYDALVECSGIRVTGGWERIRPENPAAELRRLLRMPAGPAVLVVERLALAGTVPIEWRLSVVRGDRYSFRTEWSPS